MILTDHELLERQLLQEPLVVKESGRYTQREWKESARIEMSWGFFPLKNESAKM